jgi:hypothetical protein
VSGDRVPTIGFRVGDVDGVLVGTMVSLQQIICLPIAVDVVASWKKVPFLGYG